MGRNHNQHHARRVQHAERDVCRFTQDEYRVQTGVRQLKVAYTMDQGYYVEVPRCRVKQCATHNHQRSHVSLTLAYYLQQDGGHHVRASRLYAHQDTQGASRV